MWYSNDLFISGYAGCIPIDKNTHLGTHCWLIRSQYLKQTPTGFLMPTSCSSVIDRRSYWFHYPVAPRECTSNWSLDINQQDRSQAVYSANRVPYHALQGTGKIGRVFSAMIHKSTMGLAGTLIIPNGACFMFYALCGTFLCPIVTSLLLMNLQ